MSPVPGNLPWLPLQEGPIQTHMYQICPYICIHWPPTTNVDTNTKKFHCHVLYVLPAWLWSESRFFQAYGQLIPKTFHILGSTLTWQAVVFSLGYLFPHPSSLLAQTVILSSSPHCPPPPTSSLTSISFLESLLCAEYSLPTPVPRAQICSQTTWVLILPPPLPSCVISGKLLNFSVSHFLMCKMRLIMIPTSQNCWKNWIGRSSVLRTGPGT